MKVTLFICILFLSGCTTLHLGAKFNASELEGNSEKYATIFFYSEPSIASPPPMPVIANNRVIGNLQFGGYIKIELKPGYYKVHSDTGLIDRITDFNFDAGKTYFVKMFRGFIPFADYIKLINVPKEEALPAIMKTSMQLKAPEVKEPNENKLDI